MSTICKLITKTGESEFCAAMEAFLVAKDVAFTRSQDPWPEIGNQTNFKIDESFPSLFSYKEVLEQVTEIHYNSFAKLEDLAAELSKKLGTGLVVNMFQSTSTAAGPTT